MTPQEQDLVKTLVGRLTIANRLPKDAEAEALIRNAVAEQPDAPYYLMQTALIQDLSLTDAQGQIERLEKQLAEAQPLSSTSFLGAWFGRSRLQPASAAKPRASLPPDLRRQRHKRHTLLSLALPNPLTSHNPGPAQDCSAAGSS